MGMVVLALLKCRATLYTVSGTKSSTRFKYTSSFWKERKKEKKKIHFNTGSKHCKVSNLTHCKDNLYHKCYVYRNWCEFLGKVPGLVQNRSVAQSCSEDQARASKTCLHSKRAEIWRLYASSQYFTVSTWKDTSVHAHLLSTGIEEVT